MKKSDIKRVGICRKYAHSPEIKKAVHMLRKSSGYQIKCVYLEENADSLLQDGIIDASPTASIIPSCNNESALLQDGIIYAVGEASIIPSFILSIIF